MATKRLHSMIFPGLADSYTVPQQTTELSDFDNFVKAGLAIISNGNTHLDIPADMYVYVYNHNTLDNGLYQNISGATIPVGATLTTSNVSQVTGGGLNVLKNTLTHAQEGLAYIVGDTNTTGVQLDVGTYLYIKGHSSIAEGLRIVSSGGPIAVNGNITTSNTTDVGAKGGLNDLKSTATGSITAASGFTFITSDYTNLVAKSGNVVTAIIAFYTTSDMTNWAWNTITTLPIGYRPSHSIGCIVSILGSGHGVGQTYDGRITSSGEVQIYAYEITTIPGRAILQVSFCV